MHLLTFHLLVSEFDHELLFTCTDGAMGLLEYGHLSNEAVFKEAKLFFQGPKGEQLKRG
jgi:hypothetical protein